MQHRVIDVSLDFKVNYMQCIVCLNEDAQKKIKKYDTFFMSLVRDEQITTSAKLLDIMQEPYGFFDDVIDTINRILSPSIIIGINKKLNFAMVVTLYLHALSHRQLYVVFSSRVECGLVG